MLCIMQVAYFVKTLLLLLGFSHFCVYLQSYRTKHDVGRVCGQDPKWCESPKGTDWDNYDITKWPVSIVVISLYFTLT